VGLKKSLLSPFNWKGRPETDIFKSIVQYHSQKLIQCTCSCDLNITGKKILCAQKKVSNSHTQHGKLNMESSDSDYCISPDKRVKLP